MLQNEIFCEDIRDVEQLRSLFNFIRSAEEYFFNPPPPTPEMRKAQILSPNHTRISFGGMLSLECLITEEPPVVIWWWLNGTKLDLFHHRGGLNIETLESNLSSMSTLRVADFKHDDAGLYECRAEKPGFVNDYPAKSSVHVTVIDPTKAPLFSEDLDVQYSNANAVESKFLLTSLYLICIHCLMK